MNNYNLVSSNGDTPSVRAGFAQVDITPDFQVELIGCSRPDSRSQGVTHPLSEQTLLFEHGGEHYCLITIDSLGLTTGLGNELRAIAADVLGTEPAQVMLNFSHTHSAPAPLSPLNGQRYFELLRDRTKSCVAQALENLQPCKAAWALAKAGIGENRRDGCTVVDDRLGGLMVTEAAAGKPIAVALRITAHANILMGDTHGISSDYFGVAREKLQRHFGCPVMLIQGAAGNVKPTGVDKINGGKMADLDRIAEILLQSVQGLHFEPRSIRKLGMVKREITLYSDVPSEAEAEKIADEAKRLCGIDGSEWLEECRRLRENGTREQSMRDEVQFFTVDEGCLCGVPDEIFCEISLEASRRTGAPMLFFNGYTNGCNGYLPHREEWVKGGFETLYSYLMFYPFHGHVMPFRIDTASRLVALVADEWEKSKALI